MVAVGGIQCRDHVDALARQTTMNQSVMVKERRQSCGPMQGIHKSGRFHAGARTDTSASLRDSRGTSGDGSETLAGFLVATFV